MKNIYFTQTVVFGSRSGPTENSLIIFVNRDKHIRRKLVDSRGAIQEFPGIEYEESWTKYLDPPDVDIAPQINFRTSIETTPGGEYFMLWEIQPDGRFWADEDGFGAENEFEITLYAMIGEDGKFTDKFRIFNCGSDYYVDKKFFMGGT